MSEQATIPPPTDILGPGVYDIPSEEYHARTELSSTGVRKLLPPSCPALFRHWLDSPEPVSKTFEFGSAAHKLVLGVGPKLVLVDKARWDDGPTKKRLAEIREAGDIPLKREAYDAVHAMAKALREHPFAGKLFDPINGIAEQTLIWQEFGHYAEPSADHERGYVVMPQPVGCRALVDWLPSRLVPGGRLILPDYKTAVSAAPTKVERAMADHGYHIQLAWYLRGLRALGLANDTAEGVLVMQEKNPPYLVTVAQPDATAMRMADIRIRQALDIYAECTASGRWPGYADDVVLAELPPWETKELKGEVW